MVRNAGILSEREQKGHQRGSLDRALRNDFAGRAGERTLEAGGTMNKGRLCKSPRAAENGRGINCEEQKLMKNKWDIR